MDTHMKLLKAAALFLVAGLITFGIVKMTAAQSGSALNLNSPVSFPVDI
jgi:hypothetical protein